jgi:hypothetical protein
LKTVIQVQRKQWIKSYLKGQGPVVQKKFCLGV